MNNSISSTLQQKSQFVNPQSTHQPFDLEQWARDDWDKSAAIALFNRVQGVDWTTALDKILISDKLTRTNTGRVAEKYLKRYSHLSNGGWWINTLNPLADFAEDDWGCLKPLTPRTYQDGIKLKTIKYEHPPEMPVQPFFLKVTARVWKRHSKRHGVAMPEFVRQDLDQQSKYPFLPETYYGKEFWEWVIVHSLPLVITEGVKKVASLLCAGYVAIGLPGIWNFSDTSDKSTAAFKTPLNPWLQSFFSRFKQLEITIAFDSDSRVSTALQVYSAACTLANKITWQVNRKAVVKIAEWHPELGKGVDDIIVQNGIETLETVLNSALPLKVSKFRKSLGLSYPVLDFNRRYLGQIPKLSAKIVAMKSPKNTGKTFALRQMVHNALEAGQKVIVLGHRVQLMSNSCKEFGIQFLNEVKSEQEWLEASYYGLGLCIDSLHPKSKAKIDLTVENPFEGCLLIVDESEQKVNHLLHSNLKRIKKHRAEIISNEQILCRDAGQIVLADADLSDFSVDFFRKMADVGKSDVAVIQNNYKFDKSEGWNVFMYRENNPDRILAECQTQLEQGKRVLLFCGGKQASSVYSAQNVATRMAPYFQGESLVIDSDTVKDPTHEAYGIGSNLHKLGGKQFVATTGVLETGVSIEPDYFDSVFYIGYGVHSVQSVAQCLGRYRRPVDRHVWIPEVGNAIFKKFNGALSSEQIKYQLRTNKKRMESFIPNQKDFFALDNAVIDPYCESVARTNLGLSAYRKNLEWLLTSDGHRCYYVDPVKTLDAEIREIRDVAYEAEVNEIDATENPSDDELKTLNNAVAKTKAQRYKERKGNLIRTYGYCSKALIMADDDGCFRPLQLLYYSTLGKAFAASHDTKQVQTFTSKTQCLDHEISKYAVTLRQAYLSVLFDKGLSRLLTGESFSKDDPFLTDVVAKLIPDEYAETFRRRLPEKTGDRINAILDLIGYQKKYVGRVGTGGNAIRHYCAVPKFDGIDMDQIFAFWLERDMKAQEISGAAGDFAGEISGTEAGDFAGNFSGTEAGDFAGEISGTEAGEISGEKLWAEIWDAVANDTFKDMWQKVKAMGAKITNWVFTELPELISQVDPNFALGDDFAGDFALA
ncbi:hypothetical protein AM228_06735 [Planktothricoides sp. SR001]|uniref:plasmid replication protein, CyRepA1 family n=1 Tax=Planktothricoides sp. SR001 TaxID=1705388 RepID=UPI0006C37EEF|nr:plasmid replication protein, CyRepA1 family [Planktothricoides sp. SR001]KOR37561.1 hypothetical protein AM228_06735 [Planktothricoides sp. SR001]